MGVVFPVWITAQLCIVLYFIGVSIPYAFDYISPKEYKRLLRHTIERYEAQKREAQQRRRQTQQRKVTMRMNMQKREAYISSSSSSSESNSSSDEEESETDLIKVNDTATLIQYSNGMDLFDGQGCTTGASAASTMMKKGKSRGGVHYL